MNEKVAAEQSDINYVAGSAWKRASAVSPMWRRAAALVAFVLVLVGLQIYAGPSDGVARAQGSGTPTPAPTETAIPAPTPQLRLRLGLLEALQRRATFTRDHRGPFAAPVEGDGPDSSAVAAGWHAADRVYFAWHQRQDEIVFAAFDPRGEVVAAPQIIGWGRWPRIAADGKRVAVAWSRPGSLGGLYGRLYDGNTWGEEFSLSGTEAALAFAPGGALYAATSDGVWKLGDKHFERVGEGAYAQPALAVAAQGPRVASVREGHVMVGDSDLGEGQRPALAFGADGTLYAAFLSKNSLVVRSLSGGSWTSPQTIEAAAPIWPALARSASAPGTDGMRLSYLGAAEGGTDALWLARLPSGRPVLVPSLAGNVTGAWLIVHFELRKERSDYRPHDVDVTVNDVRVGQFRNTVPEGRYLFRLDPGIVFTSFGRPVLNRIGIHSRHMNPGHYAVNSDYQLIVRTASSNSPSPPAPARCSALPPAPR
jgi:hypothetical protein